MQFPPFYFSTIHYFTLKKNPDARGIIYATENPRNEAVNFEVSPTFFTVPLLQIGILEYWNSLKKVYAAPK